MSPQVSPSRMIMFCALLSAAFAASPLQAQDCQDYAATARCLGTMATAPAPVLVAAAGDLLVTAGGGTLQVFLAGEGTSLAHVGALPGLGSITDLALDGDRALLGRGAAGIAIVSLAVPSAPVLAGSCATPAPVSAVAATGSLVVAAGSGWLFTIDAADPGAMSVVGQAATITAADLALAGPWALVTGIDGIASISLADPAQPQPAGLFRDDVGVYSEMGMYPEFGTIAVDGDRALVASVQWDVMHTPFDDVYVQGAFVVLLDLTSPAAPANLARVDGVAQGLDLDGAQAYVAGGDRVLRVFGGDALTLAARVYAPSSIGALGRAGNLLAAAGGASGLVLFDVTTPAAVAPLATWRQDLAHQVKGTWGLGQRTTSSGWAMTTEYALYDLRDPLHPDLRKSGFLDGWMQAASASIAAVSGDLVGIEYNDPSYGPVLSLYDFSQSPAAAVILERNAKLTLVGDTAWVLTEESVLTAHDAAALPALPPRGSVSVAGSNVCAGPEAAFLLTAAAPYRLRGLDLSDPDAPAVGGAIDLPGAVGAWLLDGSRAFLACGTTLVVVDLADSGTPTILGTAALGVAAAGIQLDGHQLAVIGQDAFQMVDVTEPAAPAVMSGVTSTGLGIYGRGFLGNGRLYLGHYFGLDVYEVSNPALPTIIGHGLGSGRASGVAGYIVMEGGAVMPLDCGTVTSIEDPAEEAPEDVPTPAIVTLSAHPNPFNPMTTVRYAVPRAAVVEVAAFDLRGARVRTLFAGYRPAGTHDVSWDGRDERGMVLPSGQYLLRMSSPLLPPCAVKVILAR